MNVEEIRDFALSLEDVTESFPFGPETIVFKTKNKMNKIWFNKEMERQ